VAPRGKPWRTSRRYHSLLRQDPLTQAQVAQAAAGAAGILAPVAGEVVARTAPTRQPADRVAEWAPLACVAGISAWNMWSLRATVDAVAYAWDGSVHEQMVRYATQSIEAGRLPLTGWFPYTDLGSAQFLHYQSLAAILTGLAGTIVGPDAAYRWSLYLLFSLWPLAIYASARIFGIQRPAAAVAALLSPFMTSFTGIGYERGAYLWTGGAEVWTQLWASWTLPFAWAVTWRAMTRCRLLWLAAALVALTTALHFESGYLAFLGVIVIALVGQGRLFDRVRRALVIFVAALAAAAWVIMPLALASRWSAINQVIASTTYVRGYGAGQDLKWLFTGQIFDARRHLPVVSLAVLFGVVVAIGHWRRRPLQRLLLALMVASLLLAFGPTTWGPLANAVPAHADMFFRRFMMGVQLAGLYLAGTGVVGCGKAVGRAWMALRHRHAPCSARAPSRAPAVLRPTAILAALAAGVGFFWPAESAAGRYDRLDTAFVSAQREAGSRQGAMIAPLVAYIRSHGGGRVYAGLSDNWGYHFRVGFVSVYRYLESQDVDEASYLVPTSSLMLGPQFYFDEHNPGDFTAFGIRYLILPTGRTSPVPARLVMVGGPYSLWEIPSNGYADLIEVRGTLSADRADIGTRSLPLLRGQLLSHHEDRAVSWPGQPARTLTPAQARAANAPAGTAPGTIKNVDADLVRGHLAAQVSMWTTGFLLLSVAYDPGWHARVDGRPARTVMLAPALVGVPLKTGRHLVVITYSGFGWYPGLWVFGLAGLVGAFLIGRRPGRLASRA